MEELNPTQFRMQTNIKAKPGSQGTLFQGGYNRNYHRGYGPDRQAEAREHVNVGYQEWLRSSTGGANTGAQRARLMDTVARSTVPSEDLRAESEGRMGPMRVKYHTGMHLSHINAAGVYKAKGGSVDQGQPSITLEPGQENTTTAIHELGHHISNSRLTEHSQNYKTNQPKMRGQEEAFADNYAQEHWRDRRGKPAEVGKYGGGWVDDVRSHEFYDSYDVARKAAGPYRPAREWEVDPSSNLPADHVPGQQPLLNKVTTNEYGVTPGGNPGETKKTDWDYSPELGHNLRDKKAEYWAGMKAKSEALLARGAAHKAKKTKG